jgi:nucleotide-binding universal stress UspA family protein
MAKKILVPLDGTHAGEAIFPKLDSLITKDLGLSDVEITLVSVVPIVNFNVLTTDKRAQLPYTEEDKKEMTQNASNYLETAAESLRKAGYKVKTVIRIGPAAEEIVNTAREIGANLIAMSTSGKSGVVRWAMGSVSDKVMRLEGKIPVLAVNSKHNADESSVLPLNSLKSLVKNS